MDSRAKLTSMSFWANPYVFTAAHMRNYQFGLAQQSLRKQVDLYTVISLGIRFNFYYTYYHKDLSTIIVLYEV